MSIQMSRRKKSGAVHEYETVGYDGALDRSKDADMKATSLTSKLSRTVTSQSSRHPLLLLAISTIMALIICHRCMSYLNFLRVLTLLPAGLCLLIVVKPDIHKGRVSQTAQSTRTTASYVVSTMKDRLLPLVWVAATLSTFLPHWASAGLAALSILTFGLVSRPAYSSNNNNNNNAQSTSHKSPQDTIHAANSPSTKSEYTLLSTIKATVLLVSILLWDNFMVWIISAAYKESHDLQTAPYPLPDNGQWIIQKVVFGSLSKPQVISLRRLANVQWGLVACLGGVFVHIDLFHQFHLFEMNTRAVTTLAMARFCRVVSYSLTLLPNPHQRDCYQRRYPSPAPPPYTWEWIQVGIIPAKYGGCNDLIVSGHATVITTLAMVAMTVGNHPLFTVAVVMLLLLDYSIEIYEGFHYSVDMWLGGMLVFLFWNYFGYMDNSKQREREARMNKADASVDDVSGGGGVGTTTSSQQREEPQQGKTQELQPDKLPLAVWLQYACPVILAYLQLVVFPLVLANYVIILYLTTVIASYQVMKKLADKDTSALIFHWIQHVLHCLIYIALGIYL
jgi:PAP2 superfamily C-terminal